MVRRRRAYRKRKYAARRKRFSKGFTRTGVLRTGVHRFKETCMLTAWSCAAASQSYGCQTYKLNDIFNSAQFKNLFDLYKITGVKLRIVPRFNQASVAESTVGPNLNELPMLYIAPNRSAWSTAPTSIPDILNDDGCKVIRLEKPVTFYLNSPSPRIVDGAGTGVPIQFNNSIRPWLTTGGNAQDADQSGVGYYSHRWAISNQNTNGVYVDVYATYYMTFKEQD